MKFKHRRRKIATVALAALLLGTLVPLSTPTPAEAACTEAACSGIPATRTEVASLLMSYTRGTAGVPRLTGMYPGIIPTIDGIANGSTGPNGRCDVDVRSLQLIAIVAKKYGSVQLNDLNRNCAGDPEATCDGRTIAVSPVHCIEKMMPPQGIDFGAIGGLGSPSASYSRSLLSFLSAVVPAGSRAETNCESGAYANIQRFAATGCHHQHIDFANSGGAPLSIPGNARPPIGAFDSITSPAAGTITVTGWAFDPDTSSASSQVEVWADGIRMGVVTANGARADVNNAYGISGNHGFSFTFYVNAGAHDVGINALDTGNGGKVGLGVRAVTVGGTKPTAVRVAGGTRYDTAAELSRKAFPTSAEVVYVAVGTDFPDSMSAGAAASRAGGPLLLTASGALAAPTQSEIQRLKPKRIVFVGGPNVMPDALLTTARQISPSSKVERVGGGDRYETSRLVIRSAFAAGSANVVFVVDGGAWTDSFSAGNIAAYNNQPVLVVNGSAAVDGPTRQLLKDLGTTGVRVVGGANVVSDVTLNSLAGAVPNTARVNGSDRFESASVVAERTYTGAGSTSAYLVSGLDFPDGLSASAPSGRSNAPLLMVRDSCVPQSTIATIYRLGIKSVTVVGGSAVLTSDVLAMRPCGV